MEAESTTEGRAPRTILFFGDSNTRGYGVGREHRFAAVLEAALASQGNTAWRCAVAHAPSDFRSFAKRLEQAVATYSPDILVWQCPTGPAAYFVRYPEWIKRVAALHNRAFEWLRERYIGADMRAGRDGRTRREALYEGRYLDHLYGVRPSRWPGVRQVRRLLVARYGTKVKATRERYLELIAAARDKLRALSRAQIVFLGIFPHDDEYFPGFTARVTEWNEHLAPLLDHPDDGFVFIDVLKVLNSLGPGTVLLSDGMHLSVESHRRVAETLLPTVVRLMHTVEPSARNVSSLTPAGP